jgi:hypothetical protein
VSAGVGDKLDAPRIHVWAWSPVPLPVLSLRRSVRPAGGGGNESFVATYVVVKDRRFGASFFTCPLQNSDKG